MKIESYGFNPQEIPDEPGGIPARVTAVFRGRFEIASEHGNGFAVLKSGAYYDGQEDYPTTGDFVMIDWQRDGDSRIVKTLPRRTYFARLDPSSSGHQEQAVAANFDYVFILQSLDRDFNLRRLERYLTLAWQSGGMPVVVLTKADCAGDCTTQLHTAQRLAAGVDVFAVSSLTGAGMDQLGGYMKPGKTVVFIGSSGVGKSSLINALAGEEVMTTGRIREKDGRGRHTTSHRQLHLLGSGAMVIDTPGMRELGMWDISEGTEQSFSDVEQYFGSCKFRDCRHQNEPGCEVKKAIQQGELSPERWESYLHLNKEARFAGDKADYLREKEQWEKSVSKFIRQNRTSDYRHMPCTETFTCQVCGAPVGPENAGSQHRNHCPHCLSSVHVDNRPGDRASLCKGIMDPIGIWVKKDGEWAIIHRCRSCGTLGTNRIAADDNTTMLMSMAVKPLARPPFPIWQVEH